MLFSFVVCSAELVIVQDGKPNAVIIATGETHAVKGASSLQKYVEKISGAKLAIIRESEPDESGMSVKIVVGHSKKAEELKIKIPSGFDPTIRDSLFEEEAFVIKTKGNYIIIGGNSDEPYQGTLFACWDLLDRLGCRWYFPGDWGEVVPEKKTVTVPDMDVFSKPDFAIRLTSLGGWIPSTAEEVGLYNEWCEKNKMHNYHTANKYYPLVGDGFLAFLVDPNEYYEKEPELYAMNKQGKRTSHKIGNWYFVNGTMLSLSNPRTYELAVQNLKDAFEGKKKLGNVSARGFGISPPDGAAFDYDPKSEDLNQNFNYPTYIHHPMTSEEFFGFAAKLAKEFPDKIVSTMAYAGRESPPQGVKFPKNIAVMYAPISSCVLHTGADKSCWRRTETMKIIDQYCRMTPHVYMYDYNPGFLLGSFLPERDVANFAVNAPLYKKMGMKGFTAEGRKAFMQTWLSWYMRGRFMWNANSDVNELKKDFYNTFFGPEAGPLVQAWWDECEKALGTTTMHCHEDWLVNHVYNLEFTKRIHKYVDDAGRSKMTPEQRKRFDAFALIADHLEAFAEMEEAEKNLDYKKAGELAGRMQEDKIKLIDMYSFFIGNNYHPEFTSGRKDQYIRLNKMVNGESGVFVAGLPVETKFKRDLFNEGVLDEWYLPKHNDSEWETKNTFFTWDAQDKPEDSKGHDYDGYGWYRASVNVPGEFKGKKVRFHCGGVINEAWIWVNGEYAGHKKWDLWWAGRQAHECDFDVTDMVKPGETNNVTIRIWNNAEIGGVYRRGFFWSPNM